MSGMVDQVHQIQEPGGNELAQHVRALREAFPRLLQLRGAVVVIKYGGAVMGDDLAADDWARDVVLIEHLGLKPVIVHGGGKALTETMTRMGIESSFVDGHRVTSAESADVALMVLSGRINNEVVSRINRAGGRAMGLSGTDGGLLQVGRLKPQGHDIGFVGAVQAVDPEPIRMLLDRGYLPVISSTATDRHGDPHNINADLVAGAVAAALGARSLVFLSDVPGVIVGGERVALLPAAQVRELLAGGDVSGGMRPKLEAALAAVKGGVERVALIDGRVRHALVTELFFEQGRGTLIVPDAAPIAAVASTAAAVGTTTAAATADTGAGAGATPIPGALAARGAEVLLPTYARYPIEIVSGSGARVTDTAGRSYLDFAAGIAVSVLGHGHPAVVAAIRGAAAGILHTSNLYWTEPMVALAEKLTRAAGMDKAFFCNSGAEAVETGLKLARKARPGRSRIVVFERSFHGRTFGALSATMQTRYQEPFRPLLAGFAAVPFGDFDAVATAVDGDTAAVLVEPIQGEGGVRPAPAGFLAHLRKVCDRAGALLLLDEVQTGIGRTGTAFAFEPEGIRPDAIAVAKALAGGLPMGALLARGEAAAGFVPGDHGSTFGGGPLVARVASAVLDVVLAPEFLAGVRANGERLAAGLAALAPRHPALVTEARGRGLMWGLQLTGSHAAALVAELHPLGLLTVPSGPDVLRLLPPLVVTAAEIDEGLGLLEQGIAALAARLTPVAASA